MRNADLDNAFITGIIAVLIFTTIRYLKALSESFMFENLSERLGKTLKNVPTYISRAQLTDEIIAETEERLKEELKAEGKPEAIWDRILPGKLERFISDNTTLDQEQCLLDQNFIKDEKKTVAEYVKTIGNDVSVIDFKRVSLV